MSNEQDPDDILAMEYVLGLLPDKKARQVERQLLTNARLRGYYHGWVNEMAGFNTVFTPVRAPDKLAQLERKLFWKARYLRFGMVLLIACAVIVTLIAKGWLIHMLFA